MAAYVSAVIVAAGGSIRMGIADSKQFIPLLSRPAIEYTLKAFQKCHLIKEVVVVCREQDMERIQSIIDENNFTFSENVSRMEGAMTETNDFFEVNKFGSEENLSEIRKNMEKLAITIEMRSFEKAENFASNVKELIQGQDEELDRLIFRMILTVRKSNYEKAVELLDKLKDKLAQIIETKD